MIKYIKHNLALKLDSLGFFTSALCAIHCAIMPFVLVFLALYGLQFIATPIVEYLFIASSIAIGIFTFRHGYLNHHRKLYPFAIFAIGLVIILAGHFLFHEHNSHMVFSPDEILFLAVSPIGAMFIGLGHFFNRKLSKNSSNKTCRC